MSASAALQKAIFDVLAADAGVFAAVEGRIYDRPPDSAAHPFISFGPSFAVEDDTECVTATVEAVQVDVWSRTPGKIEAKSIAGLVKSALHRRVFDLGDDGAVPLFTFTRMQVLDDPDGLTTHAVISFDAHVEEA